MACSMTGDLMEALGCGLRHGNGGEVSEELRKRIIDMCHSQDVRWRGQGARILGEKERRYKLWLSEKMRCSWWYGSHGEGVV